MKCQFRSLLFWVFGIAISMHTPSYCQELDLQSYIELVKKDNIDLKQSAKQVLIAREETKIAKSALLPDVNVNGFYQRDFNRNFLFINDFDGSTTRLRTNFNNSVSANAALNQTLFDPAIFSAAKIAKLAEEISGLHDEHLHNELIVQASSLYWQAIFTKASVTVLVENSTLAEEQLAQIKKLHGKGTVSDLQVQQAEVFYKKTLPPLKNAKNQFGKLMNDLKVLANIPLTERIVLTDDLETTDLNNVIYTDEADLEGQPKLKTLKKEVEIADRQINLNKKFWYPKLNLTAAYNYDALANDFKFSDNENKLFLVQLGVSVPIFSGGSNRAKIAKASIERETAELDLVKTKQHLLNQLRAAENNYNSAMANIETYRQTILLNESELEIFKKQLSLGVVTTVEFKESRLRLTQSRLELLNSYLDLHIAHLQILRITGQIN
ncbi:TolC family protein [Allomuricauda sp. SCSIO 65647]|uniref:TolC family protein n=1 Tax=Allomuricauda sp. SCSIO 65647 TaxID=2908843 RepID=UPI001F177BAB|nr:TolC family protein [Muricauda sp. SCSIO 65647]UJH68745.1 TolC family protein [Muricauda sp. SCSIO 65647]